MASATCGIVAIGKLLLFVHLGGVVTSMMPQELLFV